MTELEIKIVMANTETMIETAGKRREKLRWLINPNQCSNCGGKIWPVKNMTVKCSSCGHENEPG